MVKGYLVLVRHLSSSILKIWTVICTVNKPKQSLVKIPNKTKIIFEQDMTPKHTWNIVKDRIAKMKLNILDWTHKKVIES